MAAPRSWAEQEQDEKSEILQKFWQKQIVESNDEKSRQQSLSAIKDRFLCSLPPPDMSQEDWIKKLNDEWNDGSAFKDAEKFFGYFKHIHSVSVVAIAEKLMTFPKLRGEAVTISSDDTKALQQYISERKINTYAMLGSTQTEIFTACSPAYNPSDVFNIQSVTKIFTGVLALRLLEEKIFDEKDLMSIPILMSETAKKLLKEHAPLVFAQMQKVNLHQALTHFAGLGVGVGGRMGDYLSEYIDAIKKAREEGRHIPQIIKLEDFIQFIPNRVSSSGPVGFEHYHYCNSGMILAALSLEYLYNQKEQKKAETQFLDFDGMMKKFVTDEAKMSCFAASPKGFAAKLNSEDLNAAYMTGSPGGGYYTNAESLKSFAQWIYEKCQDANFVRLIERFGQEFCPVPDSCTIEHSGDGPSSSAFFSLNWKTGNLIIILNDQRAMAATEVARAIQNNIMSESISAPVELKVDSRSIQSLTNCSTVFIIKGIQISSSISAAPTITYPLAIQSNMSITTKMDIVSEEAPDDSARNIPIKKK